MYSLLMILAVILITIPLLSSMVKAVEYEPDYHEVSIQQLFHLLQNEIIRANHVSTNSSSLILELPNGDMAKIEKYNHTIRRQVNNKGHEIYHRDIQAIHFVPLPYGISVTITTSTGHIYEKELIYYD